jgi:hypothetical protein
MSKTGNLSRYLPSKVFITRSVEFSLTKKAPFLSHVYPEMFLFNAIIGVTIFIVRLYPMKKRK